MKDMRCRQCFAWLIRIYLSDGKRLPVEWVTCRQCAEVKNGAVMLLITATAGIGAYLLLFAAVFYLIFG